MEVILTATVREESGKGAAHKLRANGEIPAILYGKDNIPITLNSREVQKIIADYGTSHLLQLKLAKGKRTSKRPVLIKEVQADPIKGHLLHVDLFEVSMDHKVTLTVPLVFIGQEKRPNDGSLIEQLMYEVEVSCLPSIIPNNIEVDISGLTMNKTILVKDIIPPKDVEFVTAPEEALVAAVPPKVDTEQEATEETEEEVATAAPEE